MSDEIVSRLKSLFEDFEIVEAKNVSGKIALEENGRVILDKILSLNNSPKLCRYGVNRALQRVVWHIDD